MKPNRKLLFALKATISASLITYLVQGIGFTEAADKARMLSLQASGMTVLLFFAYFLVAAVRWWAVLHRLNGRMTFVEASRITFVATFFNQFLPATVGADAIRVWESYRAGVGVAAALHSVVLERIGNLNVLALLAALGAGGWLGVEMPQGIRSALWATFVAASLFAILLMLLDRIPLQALPQGVRRGAMRLAHDSRLVFLSPGVAAVIALSAAANQALLIFAVVVLADSLGISLSVVDCLALVPAILLFSALPISIAGWGVREYAMVTGLGYVGISGASALVLSLALATMGVLSSVPGGILWLLETRARSRRDRPGA